METQGLYIQPKLSILALDNGLLSIPALAEQRLRFCWKRNM
jgi:hypothetical protein